MQSVLAGPYDGGSQRAGNCDRPELLGDMMLLEPSETLKIDEPLLLLPAGTSNY